MSIMSITLSKGKTHFHLSEEAALAIQWLYVNILYMTVAARESNDVVGKTNKTGQYYSNVSLFCHVYLNCRLCHGS